MAYDFVGSYDNFKNIDDDFVSSYDNLKNIDYNFLGSYDNFKNIDDDSVGSYNNFEGEKKKVDAISSVFPDFHDVTDLQKWFLKVTEKEQKMEKNQRPKWWNKIVEKLEVLENLPETLKDFLDKDKTQDILGVDLVSALMFTKLFGKEWKKMELVNNNNNNSFTEEKTPDTTNNNNNNSFTEEKNPNTNNNNNNNNSFIEDKNKMEKKENVEIMPKPNKINIDFKLCGFINLGSTCFMNAAFQCLLRIRPITNDYHVHWCGMLEVQKQELSEYQKKLEEYEKDLKPIPQPYYQKGDRVLTDENVPGVVLEVYDDWYSGFDYLVKYLYPNKRQANYRVKSNYIQGKLPSNQQNNDENGWLSWFSLKSKKPKKPTFKKSNNDLTSNWEKLVAFTLKEGTLPRYYSIATFNPSRIKSLLGDIRPEFHGYQQNDSWLAFMTLLNGLQQEDNNGKELNSISIVKCFSSIENYPSHNVDITVASTLMRNASQRNNYIRFSSSIGGIKLLKRTCTSCTLGYQKRSYEYFQEMTLPLNSQFIKIQVSLPQFEINSTENVFSHNCLYILKKILLKKHNLKELIKYRWKFITVDKNLNVNFIDMKSKITELSKYQGQLLLIHHPLTIKALNSRNKKYEIKLCFILNSRGMVDIQLIDISLSNGSYYIVANNLKQYISDQIKMENELLTTIIFDNHILSSQEYVNIQTANYFIAVFEDKPQIGRFSEDRKDNSNLMKKCAYILKTECSISFQEFIQAFYFPVKCLKITQDCKFTINKKINDIKQEKPWLDQNNHQDIISYCNNYIERMEKYIQSIKDIEKIKKDEQEAYKSDMERLYLGIKDKIGHKWKQNRIIAEKEKLSLQKIVDELIGNNVWYDSSNCNLSCKQCGSSKGMMEETEILQSPEYFLLRLDRTNKNSSKLSYPVNYPTDNLLIPTRDGKISYHLVAVSVHSGSSVNGGHYFAYIRDPNDKKAWYYCSDCHVNISTAPKDSHDSNAAFFVYQRSDNM